MHWGRASAFVAAILVGPWICTARAQVYGFYGGWGYVPYDVIIAQGYNDNRWLQATVSQRAWAAQQRTSDILVSQALARNQTQAAQAWETQLWWRDHLERQNAQQLHWAALRAETLLSSAPPERPSLIRWPSLLQQPQFAAGRANLEAPFRRVQAGGRSVQAEEYRQMVSDAQVMKVQIQATVVEPHERAAVLAFLDQLAAEATARLQQGHG